MTDFYLLHIYHGDGEDSYELHESLLGAAMSMVGHVEEHWTQHIVDEPLPQPLSKYDLDYYFSDSGQTADVVKLDTESMSARAIDPNWVWGEWASTFKERHEHH